MTPDRIERFRDLLREQQAQIEAADRLGLDGQKVVELDQQSVGRLARMDALQTQAMAQATGRHRKTQAARISAALARIADGIYGDCLDCGDEISIRRLELDPTVPLCIACAKG